MNVITDIEIIENTLVKSEETNEPYIIESHSQKHPLKD